MIPHVFQDKPGICIRIAVAAQVPAGIVGPEISVQETGTFFPCGILFWNPEAFAKSVFKHLDSLAARTVRPEPLQVLSFGARTERHPVFCGNFDEGFPEPRGNSA